MEQRLLFVTLLPRQLQQVHVQSWCCWKCVLDPLGKSDCQIAIGQLISPDFGQTMHCDHSQLLHSAAKALFEAAEPLNFVAQMLCLQAAVQRLVSLPAPDADSNVKNELFCAHAV